MAPVEPESRARPTMTLTPPRPRHRPHLPLAALAALAAACNGGSQGTATDTSGPEDTCVAMLDAGALVITEVMADPDGADDGREWFELHNPGASSVNLRNAVLTIAKSNGDSQKVHTIAVDLEIPAGGYITLGDVLPEAAPPHIDYGYGSELGSMNNTAGRIQVYCGETIVDQVLYTDVKQPYARSLSGKNPPDADVNDDQTQWCLATDLYNDTEYGTPGAANPPCPPPPPPEGQCWDGEVLRPIAPPRAGDLVVNEFHANPKAVDDGDGEFLELLALADVDLNGLTLGKEPGTVLQTLDPADYPTCLHVPKGSFVVFAAEADPAVNGGIPKVDYPLGFSLTNSASGLFVGAPGGELVDAITYATTTDGAASSLDPAFATADQNDLPTAFCAAQVAYGDGDLGTPGAANPACPQPPPEDQCDDGGVWRDIMFPQVGDLVINEVLADPAATPDADGEYLEIYVGADVDLNRLMLGKDPGVVEQILGDQSATCLPIAAGTYLVLAHDPDPLVNGGLPDGTLPLGFSLGNSGSGLWVSLPGVDARTPGELLDETAYGTAPAGHSLGLDPGQQNPLANDDPMNWCPAADADVYGAGDFGTPGAQNGSCMIVDPGQCNDNGMMRAPVPPGPGDLTLTEYMPDPKAVADGSGEWFELRVNKDCDLNNLQLGKQPDKVEATLASPDCLAVKAGDFLVFAHSDDPMVNGGLPKVDFTFGFSLVNSAGGVFAGIDGMVLTEVDYATSTPGAATSLDPNDVDWCPAVDPYGAGDLGTPGAQNPACGMMPDPGTCTDPDDMLPRDAVAPVVGDLVITEFLADPAKVADAAGEWIELYVAKDVDLNGLQWAKDAAGLANAAPLASPLCLEAKAGTYVLFAKNTDAAMNGGLPVVDHVLPISLTNGASGIAVGIGGAPLDTIAYTKTQAAGKARGLDPASNDPALNDAVDALPWCVATMTYGLGDFGTPKAENPACM